MPVEILSREPYEPRPPSGEPPEPAPPRGWQPAPLDSRSVLDINTGSIYSVPAAVNGSEAEFLIQNQGGFEPRLVAGTYDLSDALIDLFSGTVPFVKDVGDIPTVLRLERAERAKEILERPWEWSDLATAVNPAASQMERIAAFDKLSIKLFGGDDEGAKAALDTVIAGAREELARTEREIRVGGYTPIAPDYWLSQLIFDVGGGLTSVGAAIGLLLITRNPYYTAPLFAALQKTKIYQEARKAGKNPIEAGNLSSLAGATEGVLEAAGNALFLRIASQSRRLVPIILRTLEEGGQELSQGAAEEIITQASGIRPFDIKAGMGRALYQGAIGMLVGAPVATTVQMIESIGRQEGLSTEAVEALKELMVEMQPRLQEHAATIIEGLQSRISYDPKVASEAADFMQKFLSGEPIDLDEMMSKAPTDVKRVLAGVVREEAEAVSVVEETRRGRIREVRREIGALDEQIADLESQYEARQAAGKPVVAIQKKIDKLTEQSRALDEEWGRLTDKPERMAPHAEAALPVKPGDDVLLKARDLTRLSKKSLKQSERDLRKGFREGVKAAKTSIKEAQTALINTLEKSGLAPEDRAKFIRSIKNIQDAEQLQKRLPGLQARVMRLLDTAEKEKAVKKLKSLVKKTKPTKTGGRPVGKYTPETQEVLDEAREILALKPDVAAERLDRILAGEIQGDEFTNRLLAIAARDSSISPAEITELHDELENVKKFGAAGGGMRALQRRIRANKAIEILSNAVTQGRDIDAAKTAGIARRIRARMKRLGQEFASWQNAWDEIIDTMFNKKGVDAAAAIEDLRMTRELQHAKSIIIRWNTAFVQAGMEAFGFKSQRQLFDRFIDDEEVVEVGTFYDVNGRKRVLNYSRAQARKLWMEYQDDTISHTISHEKGNAFTEEMREAVFGLLDQQDRNFAEAQLALYQEFYPEINAVYGREYGVNLPYNANYSPIMRDRGGTPIGDPDAGRVRGESFFDEMRFRRLPASLKSRVENVHPLAPRSDVAAINRHMHDMAHFIATAEKARFLNRVFSNPRLRKEIAHFHTQGMMRQVDGSIQDFTRGYLARGMLAEEAIGRFNRAFSRSVLALKATIGMKQLTSYFAMAENIPIKDFVAGSADFAAHPREAVRELYNLSALMQLRGPSPDLELARINAGSEAILRFKRAQTLDNAMMAAIHYGDRMPIYMGGWAVYQYALKQGKTKREAIQAFEDAVSSTQQSTDIDKLSDLQRMGALGRTLTLFMTSRLALLRGEMRAIRQFRRGKITVGEFGKRIAVYHFIMPSLVQFIASGFRFEPDRQLLALGLGQLNNLAIAGDLIATAAVFWLSDEKYRWTRELPFYEVLRDLIHAVDKAIEEDVDTEEFMEAVGELADIGGLFTGYPVEQARNAVIGGMKISEGETEAGVKRIIGFSPTIADE